MGTEEEGKSASQLVVIARVREAVQKHSLKMSGDFIDAVSAEVEALLEQAAKRCKDNGRATLRPYDL